MTNEIIVAALAFIGTVIGSLCGVVTSNNKTLWRIEQLENKVNKHNNLVERMAVVEQSAKSAHHRLDEIVEEVHFEN